VPLSASGTQWLPSNIQNLGRVMDLEKRIREIAYSLWVAEGYPAGQHDRHWRMAKQMAKEEAERSARAANNRPEERKLGKTAESSS
jgi:hypothetical protein